MFQIVPGTYAKKKNITWNSSLTGNPEFYLEILRNANHRWKINYSKTYFPLWQDVN